MKLGIVTDSTADLPSYLIEQHEIEVVPAILVIDGKEYVDGQGISREEFYTQLPTYKKAPTTAAPSIGEFTLRYERLLSKGCTHILSIHPAEQLTTTVNVARQAAHEYINDVTVVDSRSLSLGLGFQVLAAAEEAESGLSAAIDAVTSTRKKLQLYAALDTMEYLKRSGRVPAAVAALGGILSIKPMIELVDGEVKPIGAVRSTKQADEKIVSTLRSLGEMQRLAILHTNAEARAKETLNQLMKTSSKNLPRDILFVNVTSVIGTHVGPNGLGFAVVSKEQG